MPTVTCTASGGGAADGGPYVVGLSSYSWSGGTVTVGGLSTVNVSVPLGTGTIPPGLRGVITSSTLNYTRNIQTGESGSVTDGGTSYPSSGVEGVRLDPVAASSSSSPMAPGSYFSTSGPGLTFSFGTRTVTFVPPTLPDASYSISGVAWSITYDERLPAPDISPPNGPVFGGITVTITGQGFIVGGTTTVTFDGVEATDVNVFDPTALTCTTPPHVIGPVDVVVTSDGLAGTLIDGFTYEDTQPTISAIDPSIGGKLGGDIVTITGSEFYADYTTVEFDGISATDVTIIDSTQLTCVTPPHAVADVDVVVSNGVLTSTLTAGYSYTSSVTAPAVDAGSSIIAEGPLPAVVRTDPTVTPGFNNGIITYLWTERDRPEGAPVPTIASPTELITNITFEEYVPGAYHFTLTAITETLDGITGLTATGELSIRISLSGVPSVKFNPETVRVQF
jgi:hypothetical protein